MVPQPFVLDDVRPGVGPVLVYPSLPVDAVTGFASGGNAVPLSPELQRVRVQCPQEIWTAPRGALDRGPSTSVSPVCAGRL